MGLTNAVRILAIVPAYNEQDSIAGVVEDLQQCDLALDVLVIDDGSRDDTAEKARQAGAIVCSLPYNMGIGVAVQTGFMYAASHRYEAVCQFDGDGQHLAAELPTLVAPVLGDEADACIGSRFLGAKSYRPPPLRLVGAVWLRTVINCLSGTRLTDVTSGFRAYGAAAVRFLAEHYPMQFPEPEVIVWLVRHGFRIVESPANMRERRSGHSSIGMVKAPWYMLRVTLGVLITRFRARVAWKEH